MSFSTLPVVPMRRCCDTDARAYMMLYPEHKAVSDDITTMPTICKGDRRRVWRTQRAAHSLGVAYQEFYYLLYNCSDSRDLTPVR